MKQGGGCPSLLFHFFFPVENGFNEINNCPGQIDMVR